MRCYLDRDGVFNHDDGYVGTIERFRWHPEIFRILELLKTKGYQSFVLVTNQSGIGRGYYSENSFLELSQWMCKIVEIKSKIKLEIVYCPHKPEDNCGCRKPKSGMFSNYDIGPDDVMIGDKDTDMLAAKNVGINHRWLISREESDYYSEIFANHGQLIKMLEMW